MLWVLLGDLVFSHSGGQAGFSRLGSLLPREPNTP